MSTTDDTAPAAETERAETAPLSRLLDGDRHDGHREVGADEEPAPAAAPAAAPAPEVVPEAAAAAAPAAAAPKDEFTGKHPAWMRQQIRAERERANAAEARLRTGPQPERRAPTPEEVEERNRPLTRAEMDAFAANERLVLRVERSEDAFVDKHGAEVFDDVQEWLISKSVAPGNNPMETWALAQRNPWAAAYQQYQREKIADEIGDDPAAYRAKLEAQIREEYEAKQGVQTTAAPAPASMRPAPPAPASTARAAAPRDSTGKFTGPAPLGATFKHKQGG